MPVYHLCGHFQTIREFSNFFLFLTYRLSLLARNPGITSQETISMAN